MTCASRVVITALATTLSASLVLAQPAAPGAVVGDWRHGTTVSAAGGVGSAASVTGPVAGGAFGWELTPRLMVEGSGLWLDRRGGGDAFNGAIKARMWMQQTGVSPFIEGGVGLYRISSDTSAGLPDFYRRRLSGSAGARASVAFTDPSFHVGGGLNVFLSRHIAIQPAVEAMLVRGDGQGYGVGVFSLRVAYHFEDHPVTPSRVH